jgi:hypothetical protein
MGGADHARRGLKTAVFRDVPLHIQLVELGLIDLVKEVDVGPLFWRDHPVRRDPLSASRTVSGRLSEWIGTLKVAQGVGPNYAWRHRLKSVAMELGVAGRVPDSIQGHPGRTASDPYGNVSLAAKRKVIEAFPSYDVG